MMRFLPFPFLLVIQLHVWSQAKTYDFPEPVDTKTRKIIYQEKKTYQSGDLYVDNQFDGARITDADIRNDSTVILDINPENTPINPSAWYAFRTWRRGAPRTVYFTLNYWDYYKHRYWPKISTDGKSWELLDVSQISVPDDSLSAMLSLKVSRDTLWIAAQPLETSKDVEVWCQQLAQNKLVTYEVVGKSRDGRDLPMIRLGKGKKIVVLLSRQHPPEVTGYYALKAFAGELVQPTKLAKDFFKKHTVLIYPLLNPDGVDLGHWRHNTGGVDLNRDWAYYNQPEIRQIADHIVKASNEKKREVVLGLDFHSTYYDIYYTTDRDIETNNNAFTDQWLDYIGSNLEDYKVNDEPSGLGPPVSKGWFLSQFDTPGITFEIGDDTPADFIEQKGKVAATGMMQILLEIADN